MHDEMDILKEIATTAAAHGSNALSEILRSKVKLSLPTIETLGSEDFINREASDESVFTLQSRILTGLEGKILLILKEKSAFNLITKCYEDANMQTSGLVTEMALSVIKEIGSVVICSYVGALSMYLKTLIVPSIPNLLSGPLREILSSSISEQERENILLIETVFEVTGGLVKGSIYLVLTQNSIEAIQSGCRKILESLQK